MSGKHPTMKQIKQIMINLAPHAAKKIFLARTMAQLEAISEAEMRSAAPVSEPVAHKNGASSVSVSESV